jgi:rubrerythrin
MAANTAKKSVPWLCHDCGWQNRNNPTDLCRHCNAHRQNFGVRLMSKDEREWIAKNKPPEPK